MKLFAVDGKRKFLEAGEQVHPLFSLTWFPDDYMGTVLMDLQLPWSSSSPGECYFVPALVGGLDLSM